MKPTPDFNPAVAGKKLLREGRSGALATLMAGSGDPSADAALLLAAADGLLVEQLATGEYSDPRRQLCRLAAALVRS